MRSFPERSAARVQAGIAACAMLVGGVLGCEPAPQNPTIVHARLLEPDSPPRTGELQECRVGNEVRPAKGCLWEVTPKLLGKAASEDRIALRYAIDRRLRRRGLLVQRKQRADELDEWRALPSLIVKKPVADLLVFFDDPASSDVRATLYPVPDVVTRYETRAVRVPPDAILAGGIAFVPTGLEHRGPPVAFAITARASGAAEEPVSLWRRVVDPRVEGDEWIDYRVDLGRLEGKETVFRLSTEIAEAETAADGASFPLWSLPRLLAPAPRLAEYDSVILISIDTLRADHVGVYGSERPLTPNLDRFAEDATLFETAMATFPSTTASHMSMLTGMYPIVHQVYQPRASLSRSIATLPQILAGHAFTTGAVTEDGMIHFRSGFVRGFDQYREFRGVSDRDTIGHIEQVVESGLDWLESHPGERTFLFLHTYQVHGPYTPPPEFDVYGAADLEEGARRDERAYAGEVAYADHVLGGFFDRLAGMKLLDRTIVVVTADHGEGFGEHSFGHGASLHEEAIRVPLIVRAPRILPAGRRAPPVSLVDIAPTILDLLGLDPSGPVQGRSLVPLALDPNAPGFADRPVYAERRNGAEIAVRRRELKWVEGTGTQRRSEAYRLDVDPKERGGETSEALMAEGRRLIEVFRSSAAEVRERYEGAGTSPVPLDDETERELRALGYVE